jgi:hypothetical protein
VTPSAPWRFELAIDRAARGWLEQHPNALRLFIAFESTRLRRFGVRLRDIRICCDAEWSRRRAQETAWLPLGDIQGRAVLLDARLRECMPRQVPLTTRGLGPFRHLELDLSGEQWGELLYPLPR